MTQVNIKSLSSSAFASSFKQILVKNSTIDRIETNAFSGFLMSHIELEDVDINRIERGAFSDQSVIEILQFNQCKISSIAKKSIVAGISSLMLENSFIQSISKFGAINATVASVRVVNNTFRTLGQESLSVESWNSVIITDNTIQFIEEGALNAIINPIPPTVTSTTPKGVGEVIEADVLFEFTRNEVQNANRHSLVTRLPPSARLVVAENRFSHHCDCQTKQEKYIQSLTGFSGLSSSFQDLSGHLLNSSLCGVPANQRNCFPASDSNSEAHFTPIQEYQLLMCNRNEHNFIVDYLREDVNSRPPDCILTNVEELDVGGDGNTVGNGVGGAGGVAVYTLNQFYDDFLLLFQVKTTKGILLFLLFCVLCCVCVISICVGTIYIHRLYKRAKLMKSNKLSGSFQFNSQAGEKAEILRYGSNHTSSGCDEDEPQYAEIAEVHHPHDSRVAPASPRDSNKSSDDIEASTMMTTLPKSDEGGTLNGNKSNIATLPLQTSALLSNYAAGMNTLPISSETERLLPMSRYNNGYSGTIGGTPLAQSTPMRKGNGDNGFKLRPGGGVGADSSMRVSMSETSLTDEIMMALRDKLNDPTLYCTVMDAKTGCDQEKGLLGNGKTTHEEELYTAPIYNDPAPQTNMKT